MNADFRSYIAIGFLRPALCPKTPALACYRVHLQGCKVILRVWGVPKLYMDNLRPVILVMPFFCYVCSYEVSIGIYTIYIYIVYIFFVILVLVVDFLCPRCCCLQGLFILCVIFGLIYIFLYIYCVVLLWQSIRLCLICRL